MNTTPSPFDFIYVILIIIWSILCLILFFKIWVMTNDIRDIKEFLCNGPGPSLPEVTETSQSVINEGTVLNKEDYVPGTKVMHKTLKKVMIIDSINNNGEAALCKDENGNILATYHLKNLELI